MKIRKVSDIVVDKEMLKEAKVTQEKNKLPNGYVYATVKDVKEFHPIEKVYIKEAKMTVGELVQRFLKQEERFEKMKEKQIQLLDKIIELEGKVKLWIG